MDEDWYDEDKPLPPTPMQGIDVLILVCAELGNIARIPMRFFDSLTDLLMRHANYRVQQKKFAREAGLEIERLVAGE